MRGRLHDQHARRRGAKIADDLVEQAVLQGRHLARRTPPQPRPACRQLVLVQPWKEPQGVVAARPWPLRRRQHRHTRVKGHRERINRLRRWMSPCHGEEPRHRVLRDPGSTNATRPARPTPTLPAGSWRRQLQARTAGCLPSSNGAASGRQPPWPSSIACAARASPTGICPWREASSIMSPSSERARLETREASHEPRTRASPITISSHGLRG